VEMRSTRRGDGDDVTSVRRDVTKQNKSLAEPRPRARLHRPAPLLPPSPLGGHSPLPPSSLGRDVAVLLEAWDVGRVTLCWSGPQAGPPALFQAG
jgi:hypothetical protein